MAGPVSLPTQDELLTAKQLLSISGALWAVFGVVVFALIKDVALVERTRAVSDDVRGSVLKTFLAFFAVNFLTILVVQSYGVWLIPQPMPGRLVIFLGHAVSLALYLSIAFQSYRAARTALFLAIPPVAN